MKRLFSVLLLVSLLLCGCTRQKNQTFTYLDVFDTVTTVMGDQDQAQKIHEQLIRYHRLFDIYNEYDGLNNLKTVNDMAGVQPVEVDADIIRLLLDCKEYHHLTGGKVNVAMGSVLKLWHDARAAGLECPENAWLPDPAALEEAAAHTDIESIVIDRMAGTVFITDPETSLDVGAIAKGWAVQRVAENADPGMLISVGGNVFATGPKGENTPWVIGIQSPEGEGNLCTLNITAGAVVTSGDYQRTYTVDGVQYHHIIDPATRMPGTYWRSVTVVGQDSALADALSTALFLLPLEQGMALAERLGVDALWVDAQGAEFMTEGFSPRIRQ